MPLRDYPPLWRSGRRSGRIGSSDMAEGEAWFEPKIIAFVGMDENRVWLRWITASEAEILKRN